VATVYCQEFLFGCVPPRNFRLLLPVRRVSANIKRQVWLEYCKSFNFAKFFLERQELFELLYYLRVYPTTRQCGFLFGNKTCYSDMLAKFQAQMEYLISKNKFIEHWNRKRFSVDNMLPHFFSIFTNGCVDTVDVTTRKPCDSKTRE
jgi:hypothetical protein